MERRKRIDLRVRLENPSESEALIKIQNYDREKYNSMSDYILHSLTHNEGFENFFWTFEFFGLGSYRIDIWMDPNQRMQAVYLDWKNGEFHRFHQELFRHSRNRCQE